MKRCVPVLIAVVLIFMSTTAFGQHFEFVQTDVNASNLILSATINDESLVEGDEVGVFTPGGLCAGAGTIPAGFPNNALGVAAWGAEQGQQNGFRAGDDIEYRLWSAELETEVVAEVSRFLGGDGIWVGNGMNVVFLVAQVEVEQLPVINVEEDAHDFGEVEIGGNAEWQLNVSNAGNADLIISAMPIEGDYFAVTFADEVTLGPDEAAQFTVTFAPEAEGEFAATMTIRSNDSDVEVALTGHTPVPAPPVILVDPQAMDFGVVLVGEQDVQTLTITNDGEEMLNVGDFDVTNIDGEAFSFNVNIPDFPWETAGTDNNMSNLITAALLNGESLVAGDYVGVFTPDDYCAGFGEVPGANEGVGFPAWGAEQGQDNGFHVNEEMEYRFWDTDQGREYVAEIGQVFQGENIYSINGMFVAVLTAGDGFMPAIGGFELAPGESFEIDVLFAPDGAGEFTGEIVIPSDDPDNGEVVVNLLGNGILPNPEISLDDEGHNFGGVLVGESANWTFSISNIGGGDLTVESAAVTGDYFSGDGEDGFVIPVGESHDVTVTFAPEAGGDFAGEVTITSDDPNNGVVILNLAGVGEEEPVPEISVDVDGHDFGSILIGESDNWTFSIANIGNAALTVETAAVTGDFFSGDGEDGFVIAVGESHDVTVTFAPEAEGDYQGEVIIISDDPNFGFVTLDLFGAGEVEAMPDIMADPEAIDFGDVILQIGDVQHNMEEEILTISNAGDAPLTVFDAVLEGDGFFFEMDLGNGGGGEEFNWEFVQTDANMSILVLEATINGEALQAGDYIGSFTEAGLCAGYSEVENAGQPLGVPAWGAEQGQQNGFRHGENIEMRFFDTDPGREYVAEFARIEQGESFFVANGFTACALAAGNGFMPAEVTLNPGEELQGIVYFGPVGVGEHNGTITFASDDPDGDLVVNLTGVGVLPAADIEVNFNLHDFGSVMVGESAEWAFNITNVGGEDLTVQSIDVAGDFFSVDAGDGFVLASEEVREVMVTFAPENGGEFDGSVTIISDDEDEGEVVLALTGMGEVEEQFPAIAVDNDVIDFGGVLVGEGAEDLLVISNEGDAPLTITGVAVEGAGFTIDVDIDGGGGDIEEFPWEFVQTDVNMSTLIQAVELNGEPLGAGNYVGVFTENGTCGGYGEVVEAGAAMGVPAWGAEQGQQNGFVANEPIEFRFWETEAGREYVADVEVIMGGEAIYVANGLLVCNLSAGRGNMPAELVLEPGGTLEVPVFFNPDAEGDYEGAITITSDDPDDEVVMVGLLGVGVVMNPEIIVDAEGHDFGVIEVGQMADWSFNITNVGDADLNVESVVVDGNYFYVDVEAGFVLASGEDRDVGVAFEPQEEGEFGATVTITSNDPENGEIVLNLTGVGEVVEVPSIAVDNDVIDFGDVLVGEGAEDLLVISNEGGAPLTIIDVTVEGAGFTIEVDLGGDVGEFNWEYVQTDVNMSTLIQNAEINGEALAVGNFIGVFTENGTCAGYDEVVEVGAQVGVPAWGAEQGQNNGFVANEPIEFRFWETEAGREYVADVEVIMGGEAVYVANGLLVCNLSAGRGNMPAELVLDPGATLEIPVFFNPEEEMDYEGAITIISDDPENDMVMVQLLGVGFVDDVEQWIGFDPEMVEFAPVIIGEQGEEILTVFNMSQEEALVISDLVIDNAVFSLDDGILQGEFDWAYGQTDNNMSIIVQDAAVNGDQLEAGDYIGVFTEDGDCAGYSEVPEGLFGEGGVGVSAWGAEQGQDNGFAPEENIEFRIWDTDASRQYVADPEIAMGETMYVSNGFLVLSGLNAGGGMNPAELAIEPGGSIEIMIFFNPEEAIEYNGTLTVRSNDPVVPEAVVDLTGNGSLPAANINVSAEAYDFEGVHVGDPADWTFTISNIGGGNLTVESVVTEGDGFTDNMDEGFVLESGASQEIMVTFSPDAPEEYVGSVTIISDDEDQGEVVIDLVGFGFLNAPVITLSAEAYDFGELFVGDTGEWSFEIGNNGETDLNVGDITVDGMYFSIDEEGGFSLEPGEVAEVVVTFAPEDAGEFEGTITVSSDDPNGDAMVAVTGTAVWYPMIALDPDDVVDFGELYVNDLGEAMVNISNPGGSPLTVSDVVAEGDYFFMEDNGNEPGNFDWEYARTDNNMSIIVQDAAIDGEQLVAGDVIGVFTGAGMCAGYSEVPEGLFGDGGVGVSAWGTEQGANNGFAANEDIEFQIWDMDAGMAYVAAPEVAMGEAVYVANGFLVLSGLNANARMMMPAFVETVIAAGESIDVPVFFMPEGAGEFRGTLTVFSDAMDMEEVSVGLFGIGISRVMMGLSDNSHNFGELLVGETVDWAVSIENIGEAELVVESINFEGQYFAVDGPDGGVLEAGEFIVLRVSFVPEDAGEFEGVITIISNAPEATVTLTGSAIWFPIIRLEPTDIIDFGAVPIEEEVVEMLRIYNDGRAPLNVGELQIDGEGFSLGAFHGEEPGEFDWEFAQTDVNLSILVTEATLDGQSLVEGDVVGAFTENGLCTGFSVVPAGFPDEGLGISAWGAEQGQGNGFRNGEVIGYRFWDSEAGRAYEASANYMQGNGHWVGNGFFVVRLSAEAGFVPVEAAEIVEPESFIDVEVFFRPEASGDYEGNITVLSNDLENGELNVHLMGNAFVPAFITVSEEGHDFGELLVGENAEWQFTVGNAGEADLNVESIRILGDYFSLVPDDAFVLGAGEELEFTVTFAPEDAGEFNGNVVIISNDPVNGEAVMNLTGTAVWFPIIALDREGVINFGEMFDGGEVEEVVVITNEGQAPLTIENIRVAGNGFALGEMDMGDPIVLEPDESFEASVFFLPDNEGEFNGTFTVISDDPSLAHSGGRVIVRLFGVGFFTLAEIDVSVEGLDFEGVAVGESSTLAFTIANLGQLPLAVEGVVVEGEYYSSDVEGGFEIRRDGSMVVEITFAPELRGDFEGMITILSNDQDSPEVMVSLAGMGLAPVINVDPMAIDFGRVFIDEEANREIVITNEGDADLLISDLILDNEAYSFDPPEAGEFDWVFERSDASMNVLVLDGHLDGRPLAAGDVIGVFTDDGICGGFTDVPEEVFEAGVGIAVWADEVGGEVTGFVANQTLNYRIWDESAAREYAADAEYIQGDDVFVANGFSVINITAGNGFVPADVSLAPGESESIMLYFRPTEGIEYEATLTVVNNDPEAPEVVVDIMGEGRIHNQPPVWVDVPAEIQTDEDTDFSMEFVARDPDDDPMTITFVDIMGNLPDEAMFEDNEDGTGVFSWRTDFTSAGEYEFRLTVEDNFNNSTPVVVHLTVNNINRAPIWINPIETVEAYEDEEFEIFMESMDPDRDNEALTITYDFEFEAGFVDHGDGACTFTWRPDFDKAGDHVVTFTTSDGDLSAEAEVTITIINVNRGPELESPIGRFEMDEDDGRTDIADLDSVFFDPDGDELMFDILNIENLGYLGLDIDENNVLSVLPDENYFGETNISIIADDGVDQFMLAPMGLSNNAAAFSASQNASRSVRSINNTPAVGPDRDDTVSDRFRLVVNSVNDLPVAEVELEDITVDEDSGVIAIDISGVFSDVEDNNLDYSVTGAPAELNAAIANGELTFDPDENFNLAGGAEITVTAEDDDGAMAELSFMITIIPVNDAPVVANPIDDQVFDEDPGRIILGDLDDVFMDVDGDDLEYTFETEGGDRLNMGMDGSYNLFLNPDEDFVTPDAPVLVTLTATDPDGATVVFEFTIAINPVNDAPIVVNAINNVTIDEDSQAIIMTDLDNNFQDPDGQVLAYEISGAPDEVNMIINQDNVLIFHPDPDFNLPDGVDVTITASDPFGESVDDVFRLTIRAVNDAPTWVEYPVDVVEGLEGVAVVFDLIAGDIDSEELTIDWVDPDGITAESLTDNGDGTASIVWTPTFEDEGEYNPTFSVSDGQYVAEVSVSITITDVPQLQHFVDFIETGISHSILIDGVALDGNDVPSLWEVGVFNAEGVLAGGILWNAEEGQVGGAVWGDDPDTDEPDGMRNNEEMLFKIWDFETDTEFDAVAEIIDGSINWTADGFTILNLNSYEIRDLHISFTASWNIMSMNIVPEEQYWSEGQENGPDIVLMLEQLFGNGQLHNVLLIKNDSGRFYHPRSGFKNLAYWDLGEGYAIRMEAPIEGTWSGSPIPADTPVTVRNGWNYVPYYPTYQLRAVRPDFFVLSDILGNVRLAKNGAGRFMAPQVGFSNMPPWVEGQGYQVKMEGLGGATQFTYPADPEAGVAMVGIETEMGRHYIEPVSTGDNMSVLISSITDFPFSANDQIAAFNADGQVVGTGMVDEEGRCGLAVWGTDQTSEDINGLQQGEAFELKLWDADRGVEVTLMPTAIQEGKLEYETDGFVMLDLGVKPDVPETYFLSRAYPNPFNSTTRLAYGMPETGYASVNVFDMSGRLVANLVDGTVNAGYHNVVWGGADLATGVYMIQFEAAGFKSVSKVVLMK